MVALFLFPLIELGVLVLEFSAVKRVKKQKLSQDAERGGSKHGSLHPQEVLGHKQAHHLQGSRRCPDQHRPP